MTAVRSRAARQRQLAALAVRRRDAEAAVMTVLEAENAILLADLAAGDRSTSAQLGAAMGLTDSAIRMRLKRLRDLTASFARGAR